MFSLHRQPNINDIFAQAVKQATNEWLNSHFTAGPGTAFKPDKIYVPVLKKRKHKHFSYRKKHLVKRLTPAEKDKINKLFIAGTSNIDQIAFALERNRTTVYSYLKRVFPDQFAAI